MSYIMLPEMMRIDKNTWLRFSLLFFLFASYFMFRFTLLSSRTDKRWLAISSGTRTTV